MRNGAMVVIEFPLQSGANCSYQDTDSKRPGVEGESPIQPVTLLLLKFCANGPTQSIYQSARVPGCMTFEPSQ